MEIKRDSCLHHQVGQVQYFGPGSYGTQERFNMDPGEDPFLRTGVTGASQGNQSKGKQNHEILSRSMEASLEPMHPV